MSSPPADADGRSCRRRNAALASLAGLALTSTGVLLHAPGAEAATKPATAHQVQGTQLKAGQSARLSGDALFGFDSAHLTPQARKQLRQLERALKLAVNVRCDGYADFGGNPNHERALSSHRAAVVCAQLAHHVPGLNTKAVGFGSTHPVVTAGTPADRAANRRVVITVTKAAPAAPKAPRLDSIVAGNGRVTVTFTARGIVAPGTRYEVSTDGGNHWRAVPATQRGAGTHRVVVTGLHNKHEYRVVVRARNAAGAGKHTPVHTVTPQPPAAKPTPPPSQPTPPAPTPPAPTPPVDPAPPAPVVPAAPQLGEVGSTYDHDGTAAILAWFSEPADVTGVTGYEYTLDDGTTWLPLAPSSDCIVGSGSCLALLHVDPDATYTLRVRAVTATTKGVASGAETVVVPSALPAAPTIDRATVDPSTGAVTVGFTDGYPGGPIQSYQYSTDGGDTWQDLGSYDFDFDTLDEVALTPFTLTPGSYTLLLRSVNSYGTGVSAPLVVTVPAAGQTPGAPSYAGAGLTSADGVTDLYLSFGAPSDDGGSPITGYQYQSMPYGAELDPNGWQDFPVTGSGPYTVEVPFDAENGTSLYVRAVNAVGPSGSAIGTNMPPQV